MYGCMAKAPTADRKGGEGAKDIDSRPVAAEGEPNRSRSGDSCLFFFLSVFCWPAAQKKREEEERMMEESLDLSRSICGG